MSRITTTQKVLGFGTVLTDDYIFLSPAIGLLLSTAPHIVANSRRFPNYSKQSQFLANELFFQRYDKLSMRRYGPVTITKSRSKASYWLTTAQLGQLLGLALSSDAVKGKLSNQQIDKVLLSMGIECNYVQGEWTGVSLEKYRMIIRTLTEDYKGSTDLCRNPYANQLPSSLRCSLSIPIYLQYVWEKANSRQCLLEFLLNIEKELQQPIIAESVADLRNSSSDLYKNWTNPLDIDERITEEDLKKAVNYLCSITNSEMKVKIDHEGMSPGLALEIVAASIASLKLSIKAPIKLGKYQYLNGKAKPDCVEVVVRELIEGLIYDHSTGSLQPDLLPSSCSPLLRKYFQDYNDGIISDDSLFFSNSGVTNHENNTSAGQQWFNICSNIPSIVYLSSTHKDKDTSQFSTNHSLTTSVDVPYELKPTNRNVVRVCEYLLQSNHPNSAIDFKWDGFRDLIEFWNTQPLLSDSRRNKISLVNEELVSYRAPHSDSERIYKEITTLKIIGDTPGTADSADGVNCFGSTDSMVMEIELEASHNLAMAKTHYIFNNNTGLNVKVLNNYFNNQLVETFNKLVDPNRGKINGQISSRFFPYDSFLKILFCTSLDETIVHELVAKVQVLDRNERKTSQSASNWDYLKDVMIDILIISNKWSEDRRISYEYTPSSVEGHYKNAMAVNAAAATLSETQKAYKGNIMAFETIFSILIRGNNNIDSTNVNKVVDRIVWLFDESPAAITTEIIARVLLKQKMYESKSTIRTDKQKGVVSVSTLLSSQKIKDAIERREKSSSLLILCMVDNIISYNSNSKNNISNGLMCLNHGEIGRVFLFKLKNFFHT